MIVLYVVVAIIVALILFMIVRTICARPQPLKKSQYAHRKIDKEMLSAHLSAAVQIPTVTLENNEQDGSCFYRYQAFLEKTYPLIAEKAEKIIVNKYSVIYKLHGSDPTLLPIAVLAHQDVVPAPPEGWDEPPFSGATRENCVYGRGSQDMKSQMIVALDALELLFSEGFNNKRGIYFCFGHDEERQGVHGAKHIAEYLLAEGTKLEFVIDEGGTILDGKILGINNKVALIGTCEKGYLDCKLEVNKVGGHASSPKRRTAVGLLAEAVYDIEVHKMPAKWTKPTKDMIKALAPYMNPIYKFVFVNRDIFSPLLKKVLTLINPMVNGLIATTIAATQLKGADAPNVLPPQATANLNVRLNICDTTDSAIAFIKKVVGKNVTVTVADGAINPSPVSSVTSNAYKTLTTTISEVFDGFVTAPYPFIAASDAKYYYNLTNNVYRFTPFEKSEDDANRIHAKNERQNIDSLEKGAEFFLRLYENACE